MRPKPNWLCSRLDCQRVVVRAGIHNLCVQADGCKDATGCLWYGWMWPEADWPLRGRLIGKADGLHRPNTITLARLPGSRKQTHVSLLQWRRCAFGHHLAGPDSIPKADVKGDTFATAWWPLCSSQLARFKARRTRLERERAHATKRLARGRHRRPTAGRSLAADATGQSCRAPRCGRGAFPRTGRTPSTRP